MKGAQKAGAKLYADIQAAEKLLEAGQDGRGGDRENSSTAPCQGRRTTLHWAAAEGHLPMVRWLAVHNRDLRRLLDGVLDSPVDGATGGFPQRHLT